MAALPMPRSGGGLSFISGNAAMTAFDREANRARAARKEESDAAVDGATRSALAETYGRRPAAGTSTTPPAASAGASPAPAPTGGAASEPPSTPAASTPRPPGADNPMAGAISRLSAVPGAGARAMQLAQRGETIAASRARATAADEQRGLTALARGDIAGAEHWLGRAGFQLPPALRENAETAGLFGRGSLLARGLYPNKEQALTFARAFVESRGDVNAARTAAGAPRPAVRAQGSGGGGGGGGSGGGGRSGAYSLTTIVGEDGQPIRAWVNRRNPNEPAIPLLGPGQTRPPAGAAPPAAAPAAPPTGRDGEAPAPAPAAASPYARVPQRPAGAGSQARPSDREIRYQKALESGATPEEAAAVAAGIRPTPGSISSTYARLWASNASTLNNGRASQAQISAATDAQMTRLFGEGWDSANRVRPPPRPATPTPPQPPAQRDGGGLAGVQAAPAAPPPLAPAPRAQVTTDGQTALTSTPSGTSSATGSGAAPAPAAAAPAPGAAPRRPASVPPGSAYSPSRQQWRSPDGRMFDSLGNPLS